MLCDSLLLLRLLVLTAAIRLMFLAWMLVPRDWLAPVVAESEYS